MVKAKLSNGAILLGLSAENIKRLIKGMPIKFDGRPVGFPGDVIIMNGDTEDAIAKVIMAATDVASSDTTQTGEAEHE